LLRFALPVVLASVLVSGCSDDPVEGSTVRPPKPSTSTTSASATPDTPEEQVEAAVRAYYAELTRAAQTNDTSVLKTMTTKGCPCYRAVRVIDRNKKKGRTTPNAEFGIQRIRVHDVDGATALAQVRTQEAAYQVFNARNRAIGQVPARSHFLDLSLIRTSAGEWVVGNEFNLGGDE
jgi:hypothetical protein